MDTEANILEGVLQGAAALVTSAVGAELAHTGSTALALTQLARGSGTQNDVIGLRSAYPSTVVSPGRLAGSASPQRPTQHDINSRAQLTGLVTVNSGQRRWGGMSGGYTPNAGRRFGNKYRKYGRPYGTYYPRGRGTSNRRMSGGYAPWNRRQYYYRRPTYRYRRY